MTSLIVWCLRICIVICNFVCTLWNQTKHHDVSALLILNFYFIPFNKCFVAHLDFSLELQNTLSIVIVLTILFGNLLLFLLHLTNRRLISPYPRLTQSHLGQPSVSIFKQMLWTNLSRYFPNLLPLTRGFSWFETVPQHTWLLLIVFSGTYNCCQASKQCLLKVFFEAEHKNVFPCFQVQP